MTPAGRDGSMDQFTAAFHGMARAHIDAPSHRGRRCYLLDWVRIRTLI
jgi:hypothetical protein